MEQIAVNLKDYSYQISIGENLDYGALVKAVAKGKTDILIVTNNTIAPLYLEKVSTLLTAQGFKVNSLILQDGECYKTIDSYMQIMSKLMQLAYGRDCILVALGGGVIGDVTGFAAATYQRGVDYIQIPTTLLAMVDSSVGGKTAVNHPMGKNMIGAFYQPLCVLADINVLKTLPKKELIAGLGEVIKYALILDKDFFEYLKDHVCKVFDYDHDTLLYIIKKCCQLKAFVVGKDEKESSMRAILNFGHTFGHAIEAHEGFGTILHGQAVGLGMYIACAICKERNLISVEEYQAILELLQKAQLPIKIPYNMTAEDFIINMRHDKKVKNGVIRYVLIDGIGKAIVSSDLLDNEVLQLIDKLKSNS